MRVKGTTNPDASPEPPEATGTRGNPSNDTLQALRISDLGDGEETTGCPMKVYQTVEEGLEQWK